MTTLAELQQHLIDTRRYGGKADGLWGKLTEAGILLMMTDGPDTALVDHDFADSAQRLRVQPAAIKAFWLTEASGAGFTAGRPKILPERHRFSKDSGHRFDASNPTLSYPRWGTLPYPVTQDARYDMLLAWGRILTAAKMPIDAMFDACSYGAPQIMGENHQACGYATSWQFAEAMARDEATQLRAFEGFVTNDGILPYLRKVDRTVTSWQPVADRYNGTASRLNNYAAKACANFIKCGGV